MNQTSLIPLESYEENRIFDTQLTELLNAKMSIQKKENILRQLQKHATTPLVQSRILYYQKKLKRQRYTKYERILSKLPFLFFWLYILAEYDLFIDANFWMIIALVVLSRKKRKHT